MNTAPTPIWMREMLITKGVLSEQGLTRKAKLMRHKPCKILTLAGFDADRCAMDAWCDPVELSTAGELLALIGSRRTYELHADRLLHRDHWAIKARPATASESPVFASHICGHPVPQSWARPIAPPPPPPLSPANRVEGFPF